MANYSCEQLSTSSMFHIDGIVADNNMIAIPTIYWAGQGTAVPSSMFSISTNYWLGYGTAVTNSAFNASILHLDGILGGEDKTYVFRGKYGSIYEYWTGRTPTTSPTSGHTLTDITIIAIY